MRKNVFAGIIIFICILEITLREVWGFCNSPLTIESNNYEYICAPSQHRYRFGHHVNYNSFSQRSEEPDSGKVKILGLGDSVINGGVQTDNKDLATTLVSNETSFQLLNISAGSWGPDNCVAYLKEKGLFDAQAIVLVVSSHDAYDNMEFVPVVGVHKSFPNKQYLSACWELIDRYLIPRFFSVTKQTLDPDQQVLAGVDIHKKGKAFNSGFDGLKQIADSVKMPLLIYLHPDKKEMEAQKYNEQGEEIIQWTKLNEVPLYKGLDEGEDLSTYRDGIHLNLKGQRVLANCIEKMLEEYM